MEMAIRIWNSRDIHLSKSLSWLLRHGAIKEGLKISSEGYVDVNSILQHKSLRGRFNKADVERVVQTNDKQRFHLRANPQTGVLEVKANQGHSLPQVTNAGLVQIIEPKYTTVVHGTYLKCWQQIKLDGLSRMSRQHIHFAKGTLEDSSVISGLRKNIEIYIFIDLKKALKDGIEFFESENQVVLCPGNRDGYLKPKYFSKVIKVQSGMILFKYV
ncbi:unnamed protein product [Chilo suppressalis]|uniref:2'-phosphotransferase n=1 Tax=Chilo suppressalis TaxID=168631 RepID=A0ABN8B3S4_CHISP|nr:unnamed protein product [Chilo suppressalis]